MRGTLLVALAVPAAAIVYDGVDYPWISNRTCSDDPDDCPGAGRCTQLPDYAGGNGSSGLFCRCGWFGQMKAPECQEPTSGTSNPFATYTTTAVVYGLVVLYGLFVACKAPSRTGLVSIVCVIVAAVCLGAFHVIYAVIFNGLIDRTRSSAFLIDFLPTAFGSTFAIVGIGLLYSVAIEQARVAKSGLLRTGLLVFAVAFGVLEVVLAVVGGITELAIISLVQQALILVAALVLIACASVASCKTGAGTPTTALVRQTLTFSAILLSCFFLMLVLLAFVAGATSPEGHWTFQFLTHVFSNALFAHSLSFYHRLPGTKTSEPKLDTSRKF